MPDQERNLSQTTDTGATSTEVGPAISKDGTTRSWRFFAFAGISPLIFGVLVWWMLPSSDFIPFAGHQHGVNDVTFSPDGNLVATASDDKTIRLSDQTGALTKTITGNSDRVTALIFDASGEQLINATGNGEIRIWDVKSGIEINWFQAHSDCIQGLALNSSGTELYAVGWDSTLSVWNPRTGELVRRTSSPKVAECCALTKDESTLLVGGVDGIIRAWDVSGDTVKDIYAKHVDQVKALQFSSDGTLVLSCGRDHRLSVWKYPSGETVSSIRYGSPLRDAVFFDGDTKILACAEDGSLLLFDCKSHRWLTRFESPATQLLTVAISRDHLVACGGYSDWSKAMLFPLKTKVP